MGFWLTPDEIKALPRTGASWDAVVAAGNKVSAGMGLTGAVGDKDNQATVELYARALVATAKGSSGDRDVVVKVLDRIPDAAIGEDAGSLGPSRNVAAIALAADVVNHRPASLLTWLKTIIRRDFSGKTIISTHRDRPNNWGTHAGAARIAVDLLVGDTTDLDAAVKVFRGWLGDRTAYSGFKYGDLAWQGEKAAPLGVNRPGARVLIDGAMRDVTGILPDDQRRQVEHGYPILTWPPAKENYAYEALQGALLQAELLTRNGHAAFEWSDRALLRAFRMLNETMHYPADGDDTWQPWLVNHRYATTFAAPRPARYGKNFGFTDWTHSGKAPTTPPPPDPCATEEAAVVAAEKALADSVAALAAATEARDKALNVVLDARAALEACRAG